METCLASNSRFCIFRRRISFLSHKSFGLIELVEKTVSQDLIDALESSISYPKDQVTKPYPDNIEQSSRFYGKSVDIHRLAGLLNQSTDEYEGDELVEKFTEIDSWDSLSHAIFHFADSKSTLAKHYLSIDLQI